MAATPGRTDNTVADEAASGELPGQGDAGSAPSEAAERRSLKRRGYELNFDPSSLAPCTAAQESLKELHSERSALAAEKKKLTNNIKRAKKAEMRLKQKAMGLSSKDLCEIIGMKSQLAKQWQEKKEKEERSENAEPVAAERRQEAEE